MKRKPQPEENIDSDEDASKHSFPALAASRSRAHMGLSTTRQRTRASEANRDLEMQGTNGVLGAVEKKEE